MVLKCALSVVLYMGIMGLGDAFEGDDGDLAGGVFLVFGELGARSACFW